MVRKHRVDEVLRSLRKKNDVIIVDETVYVITGPTRSNDLGNASWGKIDFLVNHNGYRLKPVKAMGDIPKVIR